MRNTNLLPRFLALFLALSLALPSPTLALRIANPVETGMEEEMARQLGYAAGVEENKDRSAERVFSLPQISSAASWDSLFGNANPAGTAFEIGPGTGRWLFEEARTHPELNFVGIELPSDTAHLAEDRLVIGERPLDLFPANVRFVFRDVFDLIPRLPPALRNVREIDVNYPSPATPLSEVGSFQTLISVLAPGGRLVVRTDRLNVEQAVREAVAGLSIGKGGVLEKVPDLQPERSNWAGRSGEPFVFTYTVPAAGLEEPVLQEFKQWVDEMKNIGGYPLGTEAYFPLGVSGNVIVLPDTDGWWNEVSKIEADSRRLKGLPLGLPLLLGMGPANDLGTQDIGVFITLVQEGDYLDIYQNPTRPGKDAEWIGQISPGQTITVGRSSEIGEGKIVEQARQHTEERISSGEHLKIEWRAGVGILLTDDSANGTWVNEDLASKLVDIPLEEKIEKIGPVLALTEPVNFADWAPSASVLQWQKSRDEIVPMLKISGGKARTEQPPSEPQNEVRLTANLAWWKTVEAMGGFPVVPGILGIQPNVVSQRAGPVLRLRMTEEGRIQVYQRIPAADLSDREQIIGSVGPGETLTVGRHQDSPAGAPGKIIPINKRRTPYSDRHFSIRWEDGIILKDEGSTWGTYLPEEEILKIKQAVDEQAAESPVDGRAESLVEAVLERRGGQIKAVVPLPDGFEEWVKSLGILSSPDPDPAINFNVARKLYDGGTIVTNRGERYSLTVLRRGPVLPEGFSEPTGGSGIISPAAAGVLLDQYRRESPLPEKSSKPTLYVEKGIFSSVALKALGRRYDVVEMRIGSDEDARRIIAAAKLLQPDEILRPVLVTTFGSDLDNLVRYYLRRETKGGWGLPLKMVSVPAKLLSSLTENNIVEYLLDLIGQAVLPGRTDDEIRALQDTWVLIRHA